MSKNTGGPAFPGNKANAFGQDQGCFEGMTLRDYAAIEAMKGFCANPAVFAANGMSGWGLVNCDEKQLAAYCHVLADAMLAERDK